MEAKKDIPVTGSGYPETAINDTKRPVYGRPAPGNSKKQFQDVRGAGAAIKGKKFRIAGGE